MRRLKTSQGTSVGPSPFPALDEYVVRVLGSRGGSGGSIRAWSLDGAPGKSAPGCITYHMKDNRFCERLGRQHKSNNVMWNVDLRRMASYQTCHDFECRAMGFRGAFVDLPGELQKQVRDTLFELELNAFNDEEAIANRQTCPKESAGDGQGPTEVTMDEREFEKALLALEISGCPKVAESSGKESVEGKEIRSQSQNATHVEADPVPDGWGEALSQAVLENPDLFP